MQREDGEDHHQKDSPSFRMESPEKIAAAVVDHHNNDEIQDDFDFSFIPIPESGPPIAADDIFSDGKIRPVYPVFNRDLLNDDDDVSKENESDQSRSAARLSLRRLFIEEERELSSTSSSESLSSSLDELDGIPPGTYCVWTPNVKDRCKKSSSTGSSSTSLRWRLRDLVVGRSQSDKFVFMPIRKDGSKKEIEKDRKKKLGKTTEVDVVTAQQRMRYYDHGQGRKSFLPYKADLAGFFANVNGLSRSRHHHPL